MRGFFSKKLLIVFVVTAGIACSTGSKQKESEVAPAKSKDALPAEAPVPKIKEKIAPKIVLPRRPPFKPSHSLSAAAEMYVEGPQQARPSDGIIPADTEVQLVRDEGSYVRVRLEDGKEVSISRTVLKSISRDSLYE